MPANKKKKTAVVQPLSAKELAAAPPQNRLVAVTHSLCVHFQSDTGIPCNYATPLMGDNGLGYNANSLQSELNHHIAPLYHVAIAVSEIAAPKLIVNLAQVIVTKQGG